MYDYEAEKPWLFTDDGQRALIATRDGVLGTLTDAGAIRMQEAMDFAKGTGSNWRQLACVDRLVELGDIKEIKYGDCAGQYRIFVKA